jgi:hypothetical protein
VAFYAKLEFSLAFLFLFGIKMLQAALPAPPAQKGEKSSQVSDTTDSASPTLRVIPHRSAR